MPIRPAALLGEVIMLSCVQEFLRQRNKPSKDEAEEAASVSLWHDMQRRDAPSSGASSDTDDLYGDQAAWGSASAGGLFDADDPTAAAKPPSAAWAATKPVQISPASAALKIGQGADVGPQGQPLGPAADLAARGNSGAQLASDLGCVADTQQFERSAYREQQDTARSNSGPHEPAIGGIMLGAPRSGSQKQLSGSGWAFLLSNINRISTLSMAQCTMRTRSQN